ncbi:hypothetical protein TrVE_jg8230 [Triparma verrucosa]|uniref:Major facilitator superfamily (MFS) profile domain-containing protein n=1 Tax=Triparma verrucosa TaxID=1606542 RepID=A0A9W7BY77_9STRA|nr:hypothetical protein TrVE_jg8230 [Triparma verrucosa]
MPPTENRATPPRYLLPSLFLSYVAVYFCRSDLTVISPILDMSPSALGTLISVGTAVYGIGKLLSGATAIRRPWLRVHVCMVLAGLFTISFASSSEYILQVLFWSCNRFAQSLIWTTLILLIHLHYGRSEVGGAVAILSQSFLVGDAVAKITLSSMVDSLGWRGVCYFASAVVIFTAAATRIVVNCQGADAPLVSAAVSPTSSMAFSPLKDRLRRLLQIPEFYYAALANGGLNLVREVFRDWIPLLLVQACAVPTTEASMFSVVFPIFGAIFTMMAGWASDKRNGRRGGVILTCMAVAGVSLLLLMLALTSGTPNGLLVLVLIAGSAALLGPYSLLSALSIDVCGVEGRQDLLPLFQGLQDGVGYFFASISGALVGNVVEAGGWAVGVGVLLGFHIFACVFTGLYAKGEGKVSTKSARRASEFELVISDDVDEAFTIESDDEEDNALV